MLHQLLVDRLFREKCKGNTQIAPPLVVRPFALEILGLPGLKALHGTPTPEAFSVVDSPLLHGAGRAVFGVAPLGRVPRSTDLTALAGLADLGLQGRIVWQDGGAVVPAEEAQCQGLRAKIVQGQAVAVLPVKVGALSTDLPHHFGVLSRRQPEDGFTAHI